MYKKLLETIIKYPKITIFRHQNPDGDAIFSCLGLKQFINDNFKDKQVHICGSGLYEINPYTEEVSIEFIRGSLGIILDTANTSRIDDSKIDLCDLIVKIDHHPPLDNYGDINIVSIESAATAELLTDIFCSEGFNKYILSKKTREYLYCGILTDSMSFTTSSTTSRTLILASKLVGNDINVSQLNDYVFKVKLAEYNKITNLRTKLIIKNKLAYVFLNKKDLESLDMTSADAKNNIAEFRNIEEVNIWAVIAENTDTHLYDASLRSRLGYQVNETAMKYSGGGHVCAAGIKNLTYTDAQKLIQELSVNSDKK